MRVLLIDNYDSFTYNLVHLLEELNCEVTVRFNDAIETEEVSSFQKIVLSPGPGIPQDAGTLNEVIRIFSPSKSILGICLGMQAIAEVFGGRLVNLNRVFHGSRTTVKITVPDEIIYKGLDNTITVGRYHSWAVEPPVPDCLEVTSTDESGHIMSLRHREFDVRGVQFHPESYMTDSGKTILSNWLAY